MISLVRREPIINPLSREPPAYVSFLQDVVAVSSILSPLISMRGSSDGMSNSTQKRQGIRGLWIPNCSLIERNRTCQDHRGYLKGLRWNTGISPLQSGYKSGRVPKPRKDGIFGGHADSVGKLISANQPSISLIQAPGMYKHQYLHK